jgi:hypothetical protein
MDDSRIAEVERAVVTATTFVGALPGSVLDAQVILPCWVIFGSPFHFHPEAAALVGGREQRRTPEEAGSDILDRWVQFG